MADHCRSCNAEIEWVITLKGARMPVDREPTPDGNLIVSAAGVARVIDEHSLLDTHASPRYTSHFATCPNAAEHRRKKPRR